MKAAARRGQPLPKHRTAIAGLALLCAAGCSQALTLGSVRGVALIGQALNVVVPVLLDAGEDATALCFDAEVFHAETRQPANRVRVRVEATPQAPTAEVRILSSAAVDEPVVTVELRAGCGQKTTRRYVLLADMPSPIAAPAPALPLLSTAPATVRPAPAASATFNPKAAGARQPTAGSAPTRKRVKKEAVQPLTKSTRPVEPSQAARPAGQARLKLDPLEFFSDRIANLAAPAPVTLPEDALRTMQRMQTLEGAVKALTASAALNEASLADLKARLQKAEKAESERFPGVLVYGLIALLLACLTALAWLWQRQRGRPSHENPWWSDSVNLPAAAAPDLVAPRQATPDSASSPPAAEASREAEPASVLDIDLMDMSDSSFAAFLPSEEAEAEPEPAPVFTAAASAPASVPATPARHLRAGTLRDIRQQAEFFVSLGQADQAVQILKQHLGDRTNPNPFVYLDLLDLLHSLDQKIEFQQLRETFNQTFSGQVPEFEFFADQGQDLETYPELLARICELWPTPQVLALIDDCIFADPGRDEIRSLDLAAFRDLLLLHAVARHLASGAELDLDLSDLTMPDAPGGDGPAPIVNGNLIEFDLPEAAPTPASNGHAPGPPSNQR